MDRACELNGQSHGHPRMRGVAVPLELFDVGSHDPFVPPPDGAKCGSGLRASPGASSSFLRDLSVSTSPDSPTQRPTQLRETVAAVAARMRQKLR